MYVCVYCIFYRYANDDCIKLISLELTMGMSVTAADYTYALYIGQTFLLVRNVWDRHVS
jgi:hypothetical protein